MLTVDELTEQFRGAGVRAADTLMVHASLRRIGPVAGGADGVVAALERAVGSEGTLFMTVGADDPHAWVNDRPVAERESLLAEAPPFDHLRDPADPEIGVLAEMFRRYPGTVASDHPEGRFAARGRHARFLVGSQPWDDYYGPGSPLERFVELDGRVLRLGADPDTVTLLHYAEYLAQVPRKRRVVRHRKVTIGGEPAIRAIEALDDSDGIVDYPGDDYFIDVLESFIAAGDVEVSKVGGARAELFSARRMVESAVAWMNQNLAS